MEVAPGMTAVDDLHATDLDDAMAELQLQPGGFGIKHDLAHQTSPFHRLLRWQVYRHVRYLQSRRDRAPSATRFRGAALADRARATGRRSSPVCERQFSSRVASTPGAIL